METSFFDDAAYKNNNYTSRTFLSDSTADKTAASVVGLAEAVKAFKVE